MGLRLLLAIVLALGLFGPALAHRGHAGLSVVEIDATTGEVSVVHRFAAHDVLPALASIAPGAQPTLDDPAAMTALEAHIGERFRIEVDGVDVPLSHTGTERPGDRITLRLGGQARITAPVRTVTVDLDFFPGVHNDQEQQVNVRIAGVTRTVIFRPGSSAQSIDFGS